jgi:hypothetical protein
MASRWKEEVEILEAEMSRVKNFFRARSLEWKARGSAKLEDSAVQEGMRAYAFEQADQFSRMLDRCEELWRPAPPLPPTGQKAGKSVESTK